MSIVDEIVGKLFTMFMENIPAPSASAQKSGKKIKYAEIVLFLGRLNEEARALRRQHRPGVLARARIILALQRRLLAAGYPSGMTRDVLFSLITSAFVGKV